MNISACVIHKMSRNSLERYYPNWSIYFHCCCIANCLLQGCWLPVAHA